MIETLNVLLNDVDARTDAAVEAQLIDATSAGTPWGSIDE